MKRTEEIASEATHLIEQFEKLIPLDPWNGLHSVIVVAVNILENEDFEIPTLDCDGTRQEMLKAMHTVHMILHSAPENEKDKNSIGIAINSLLN
ncbi:MAG TPA: hypothetical protein VH815_10370 [Acidobacteriota bacterium]|jgi:hypothetical protein